MKWKRALKDFCIWLLSVFVVGIIIQFIPGATVQIDETTEEITEPFSVVLVILPIASTILFHKQSKRKFSGIPKKKQHIEEIPDYKPHESAFLSDADSGVGYDPLLVDAINVVMETGQASVSMVQRRLNLGYIPAARLIDDMETLGIVGPFEGSRPRQILLTPSQCEALIPTLKPSRTVSNHAAYKISGLEAELYKVDRMEGHDFEYWCADLLKKNGFSNVEVTRGSGDQGVDVLAKFGDAKYAIQCKCYTSDLGNKPVQEVNAGKAFYHCHIGVVMTNRYFTVGAKEIAEATGVLLWDRDTLKNMIENGGVIMTKEGM